MLAWRIRFMDGNLIPCESPLNRNIYEKPNRYPFERERNKSVYSNHESLNSLPMQKVMCINDRHWKHDTRCPKFGEIVTVSNERKSPVSGEPCFEFIEYPCLPGHAFRIFNKKYFAPLSDLDETEFVTEEFEEKYCIPVNR